MLSFIITNLLLRSLLAFLTAFIAGILFAPYCIKFLKKHGLVDEGKSPSLEIRKEHALKEGTPVMGGLIILFGFIFSLIIWGNFSCAYVNLCLGSMIGFSIIGALDDVVKSKTAKNGLSAKKKMGLLIIVAGLLSGGLWYMIMNHPELQKFFIPCYGFVSIPWYAGIVFILFSMYVILGSSNAVNLTDGMDGLAIGCVIMACVSFAIMSFITGHFKLVAIFSLPYVQNAQELSICCFAIIGASCSFLWHNSFPATIFMGDCGSLMLGGFLGFIAIVLRQELLLILIGLVFVIEAITVILQVTSYKIRKKRIFLCAPIHHHFRRSGLTETKIIARFWIIALLGNILGLCLFFYLY